MNVRLSPSPKLTYPASLYHSVGIKIINKFPFLLIGFMSAFYINIIGQLYISEIILVGMLPFLLMKYQKLHLNRWVKRILTFGYLWLLGQVITDLVRSTTIEDLAKGWAGIIVFLLSFLSLYILLAERINRITFYILGVCAGGLLKVLIQPSSYSMAEPWKFGYGPFVTLLVLLLIVLSVQRNNFKYLNFWVIVLVVLGGFSFYLNARSIGLFTILTAVIILLTKSKQGINFFRKPIHPGKLLFLAAVFVGFIFGITRIYGVVVEEGYLGEAARIKYKLQSSGTFGLILGGRTEVIASIQAVLDSPVIGHGSWAKDAKYRQYLYNIRKLGYEYSIEQIERSIKEMDLIPAHSHFLQNWIWAGVLGAIFWIVILWIIFKSILYSMRSLRPLDFLVIYFAIASIWDIFFSPFGSVMRMEWALRLIIFVTASSYFEVLVARKGEQ